MLMTIVVDAIAQMAAGPAVQVDLARVVIGLVVTVGAVLFAIVTYFAKSVMDQFREMAKDVATIRVTLFGPTGKNGMRRDLRQTRELQKKHDRLLVALARHNGIEVDLDLEMEDDAE